MALAVAVGAIGLAGCGADAPRTALAIEDLRRDGSGTVVVRTECAESLTVEVGADHGGSALTEVTVWGEPTLGRCTASIDVDLPPEVTSIVDGTTSQVVAIQATRPEVP